MITLGFYIVLINIPSLHTGRDMVFIWTQAGYSDAVGGSTSGIQILCMGAGVWKGGADGDKRRWRRLLGSLWRRPHERNG